MSRVKEFRLPDLGEGLTEGEILKWLVAVGDEVKDGQPIVEVETAKAAVEVPSPYTGVVTKLFADEGATVDVGAPIIAVDTDPGAGPVEAAEPSSTDRARQAVQAEVSGTTPPEDEPIEEGKIGGKTSSGRTAVLVGYGIKDTKAERRPRKSAAASARGPQSAPARISAAAVAEHAATVVPLGDRPKAKPPVRKLARELGVDLVAVRGSGPDGVITREDVVAASGSSEDSLEATGTVAPRLASVRQRGEERVPIKGVRKLTAQNVASSAFTAPHVTEFITVDVTEMEALRARLATLPDFAGVKVTPLLLIARALVNAVRRHPMINATWDDAAQEIVVKHYVNLGIAAATPRGLLVPNIKDADALTLPELAQALTDLVLVAKDGKTQPADMQGGTITITNVGVFGVDTGTPIINSGESAILAVGTIRDMPWVHEGEIAIRKVTQLALSFDHRLIDGQLGSEFLADVAKQLSDPAAMLAWS